MSTSCYGKCRESALRSAGGQPVGRGFVSGLEPGHAPLAARARQLERRGEPDAPCGDDQCLSATFGSSDGRDAPNNVVRHTGSISIGKIWKTAGVVCRAPTQDPFTGAQSVAASGSGGGIPAAGFSPVAEPNVAADRTIARFEPDQQAISSPLARYLTARGKSSFGTLESWRAELEAKGSPTTRSWRALEGSGSRRFRLKLSMPLADSLLPRAAKAESARILFSLQWAFAAPYLAGEPSQKCSGGAERLSIDGSHERAQSANQQPSNHTPTRPRCTGSWRWLRHCTAGPPRESGRRSRRALPKSTLRRDHPRGASKRGSGGKRKYQTQNQQRRQLGQMLVEFVVQIAEDH